MEQAAPVGSSLAPAVAFPAGVVHPWPLLPLQLLGMEQPPAALKTKPSTLYN